MPLREKVAAGERLHIQCGDIDFYLSVYEAGAAATFLFPETLKKLTLTQNGSWSGNYAGIEAELAETAVSAVSDATTALRAVASDCKLLRSTSDGMTFYRFSLDETEGMIYYNTDSRSVTGFSVGAREYKFIWENEN